MFVEDDHIVPSIGKTSFRILSFSKRNLQENIKSFRKSQKQKTRTCTQDILLYLASSSQARHQKQCKITKLTRMFKIQKDDQELVQDKTEDKNKNNSSAKRKSLEKPLNEFNTEESLVRKSSITKISRNRALSLGYLDGAHSFQMRRLSAPEVVITPAIQAPEKPPTPSEDSFQEIKSSVPPTSLSPKKTKVSTFRVVSRAHSLARSSSISLKRLSSHDSGSHRSKPLKPETIPVADIPNALVDNRFAELLNCLEIVPSAELELPPASRKTTSA